MSHGRKSTNQPRSSTGDAAKITNDDRTYASNVSSDTKTRVLAQTSDWTFRCESAPRLTGRRWSAKYWTPPWVLSCYGRTTCCHFHRESQHQNEHMSNSKTHPFTGDAIQGALLSTDQWTGWKRWTGCEHRIDIPLVDWSSTGFWQVHNHFRA